MSLYDVLMKELEGCNLGIFSKEEQERRIAICKTCENYSGDKTHECSLCGCNINWKVLYTVNSCPAEKWIGVSEPIEPEVLFPIGQDLPDLPENPS